MNVIISGGTGLIGSGLTHALLKDGHQVWVLTRSPVPGAETPPGFSQVKWDGQTAQGWGELVNQADVLVNLAGESLASGPWSESRKARIISSRVQAGNAMVEAIQQATTRPKVLIQASAVGYYGVSQDAVFEETSPGGNDFLAGVCLAWEASTQPVEDLRVRRVIIRTGIVISLAGGAFPQMMLPFRLMIGGPMGSGKQWLSWIHIKDQVAAIRYLIENNQSSGVYNLSAPNPQTSAQFGRILAKEMGRPYWLPAPAFLLRLGLGEMSTLILDGQKVIPTRLQAAGFAFQFETAQAALGDILPKRTRPTHS